MHPAGAVAFLLFVSGACALTYQTVWLREFRLIFGASTAATAAVLAIFMGGLGIGSAFLGPRADSHPRPLSFYGLLELLISSSAALTPVTMQVVREFYLSVGGSLGLGMAGATVVRLFTSAMVLAIPALAMGGTLPAAVRAAVTDADIGRRRAAFVYGANTLGAVTGAFLATFLMLEHLGNRSTLWLACSINALAGLIAITLDSRAARFVHRGRDSADAPAESVPTSNAARIAPQCSLGVEPAVFAAAAISGFAFFLMELVWYRMLGPLLGGSVFTFGLILSMALLGIGLGGFCYTWLQPLRRPPLHWLSFTFAMEAVFMGLPLVLGDRLALTALSLRRLAIHGFHMTVLGWTAISAVVILPPALVAGYQFPLLLAALGKARKKLGSQVGYAYAWNTAGAILGSLAGGFGLLPLLSAPGAWRLTVWLLACTSLALLVYSWWVLQSDSFSRENGHELESKHFGCGCSNSDSATNLGKCVSGSHLEKGPFGPCASIWYWLAYPMHLGVVVILAVTLLLIMRTGPTAVWRHSSIGVGRADELIRATPNRLRDQMRFWRRTVIWEVDGVESSVAMLADKALSLFVNGKNDGNARMDAGTSIMSGMIAAVLHPNPVRAFVIGLGTGSTAGWLGAVESIQRVDVAELEPAIVQVAQRCTLVNHNMPSNPKVRVLTGDARELLAVARDKYDIIMSEPSNPYRAGVASLFTREFYQAVAKKLSEQGMFFQWIQTYEIHETDIESACATLTSVFPYVDTWYTQRGDMLFACSFKPIEFDANLIRQRIAREPFRSAAANVWRVTDLEGFLAHFLSSDRFTREIASRTWHALNTDDRTVMEFNCGRRVGQPAFLDARQWLAQAAKRGLDRPTLVKGHVDWSRITDARATMFALEGVEPPADGLSDTPVAHRTKAKIQFVRNNLANALAEWQAQDKAPADLFELLLVAESLADACNESAVVYAENLRTWQPAEADVVLARLYLRQKRFDLASKAIENAFLRYRSDPWPLPVLMYRALDLAQTISRQSVNPDLSCSLHAVLREPFAVFLWDQARRAVRFNIALDTINARLLREAIEDFEPHVPWRRFFLEKRALCYEFLNDPRAEHAQRDLRAFDKAEATQNQTGSN